MKVSWDYTDRAASYDKRVDYAASALDEAVARMGLSPGSRVADIGAGTGKLSLPLLQRGMTVSAVEPNDAMRSFGIANTAGRSVDWREGTGEATGLPSGHYAAALFGSSFNVVDQQRALIEAVRILVSSGWFGCMWNHRDLDDPLQSGIEAIIREEIPDYAYGSRREDPGPVIVASGLFGPVETVSAGFVADVSRDDFIEGWRSHATLARQAGERFQAILDKIADAIPGATVSVPYTTRIWLARKAT